MEIHQSLDPDKTLFVFSYSNIGHYVIYIWKDQSNDPLRNALNHKKTGTCENWGAPPPPQLGTPVHEKIMIPQKNAVCVVLWLVNGENYFTKSHRHRSETGRQLLKDTESSIWLFLGQKCESESTLSSVDWLPQTLAHAGICSCKAVAGFRQLTFPKMHRSFN